MAAKKTRLGQDPLDWIKDSRAETAPEPGDAAHKSTTGEKPAIGKRGAARPDTASAKPGNAAATGDYEALAGRVAELEEALRVLAAGKDERIRQLEEELEGMRAELNSLRFPWVEWWRLWWGR